MGFPMVLAMWTRKARARRLVATLLFGGGLLATLGGILDALTWPTIVPRVIEAHECMHFVTGASGVVWIVVHWVAARDTLANGEARGLAASGSTGVTASPATRTRA
jgi:hypothetical protein